MSDSDEIRSEKSIEAPASDDETPRTASVRHGYSTWGLALVSALNILCLGLIIYHYAFRAGEAERTAIAHLTAGIECPIKPAPPATDERVCDAPAILEASSNGNVSLQPSDGMVVEIASHIEAIDTVPADEAAPSPSELEPALQPSMPEEQDQANHWVQLGATSDESTAMRYWSELRDHHHDLLGSWQARVVGPEQAGGALYHIRIGPMDEPDAAKLCRDLQSDGGDCFSLDDRTG